MPARKQRDRDALAAVRGYALKDTSASAPAPFQERKTKTCQMIYYTKPKSKLERKFERLVLLCISHKISEGMQLPIVADQAKAGTHFPHGQELVTPALQMALFMARRERLGSKCVKATVTSSRNQSY